jgi:PHP family Zn ribbon phosphoesterase
MGVLDRVVQLAQAAGTDGEDLQPPERPEYRYQVPLDFIPGIGPKTITKLIGEFGSELKVLHEAPQSLLESVVGVKLARRIAAARSGSLDISAGGGGSYGKVQK